MNDKVTDEIVHILDTTADPTINKDIKDLEKMDPRDILRDSILSFFQNRLLQIEEEKDLKNVVVNTLISKIHSNELSIPQLLGLLNSLQGQSLDSINSVLSLLRPVPNTSSPIFDRRDDGEVTPFKNLTADENKALAFLTKVVLHQTKNSNSEGINETEDI